MHGPQLPRSKSSICEDLVRSTRLYEAKVFLLPGNKLLTLVSPGRRKWGSHLGSTLPLNRSCHCDFWQPLMLLLLLSREERGPLWEQLKWELLYWFPALGISPSDLLSQKSVKRHLVASWIRERKKPRPVSDLARNFLCVSTAVFPLLFWVNSSWHVSECASLRVLGHVNTSTSTHHRESTYQCLLC